MDTLTALMKDKGFPSFAVLASAIAQKVGRGDDVKEIKNIANKLGHLDKGKDPDWWLGGTGRKYMAPLAELLDVDPTALHALARSGLPSTVGASAQQWSFHMFPELTPLNLSSDDLFPGIPTALVARGGPAAPRSWWRALPGAGKTLVGRWLEARFGWERREARTWSEGLRDLPSTGRIYLELSEAEEPPADPNGAPQNLRLCVAAPFGPGAPLKEGRRTAWSRFRREAPRQEAAEPSWTLIETQPMDRWRDALLGWIAGRVRHGGGFQVEEVGRLFDELDAPRLFRTPGQIIDFCGLIDQVGAGAHDDKDGANRRLRWVRAWFDLACKRADRPLDEAMRDRVRKIGPNLMVSLVSSCLRKADPLERSAAAWAARVPRDLAAPLDQEAILRLVNEAPPDLASQLRRAISPPPDAWISGLEAVGALVASGDESLVPSPPWMAEVVRALALDEVFQDAPDGLGAVLLNPTTVEETLIRLAAEIADGYSERTETVLANLDPDVPERLAALDGILRAMGLAVEKGAHPPLSLLYRVWLTWHAHAMSRYPAGPLVGWIPVAKAEDAAWSDTQGIAFALLVVGLALDEGGILLAPSACYPWQGWPEDANQRRATEELIGSALGDWQTAPTTLHVALQDRLGEALYARLGLVTVHETLITQHHAHALVALVQGEHLQLSDNDLRILQNLLLDLRALERLCELRSIVIRDRSDQPVAALARSGPQWGPPMVVVAAEGRAATMGPPRLAGATSRAHRRPVREVDPQHHRRLQLAYRACVGRLPGAMARV